VGAALWAHARPAANAKGATASNLQDGRGVDNGGFAKNTGEVKAIEVAAGHRVARPFGDPKLSMTAFSPASSASPAVSWSDPARKALFDQWLASVAVAQDLAPASVRLATADASFRRYLRVDTHAGVSRIVMDAPPNQENCQPFVDVAALLHRAGLNAPSILNWDAANGFMLLTDLGQQTLMQHAQALLGIDPLNPPFEPQTFPANAQGQRMEQLFRKATEHLVTWQLSTTPNSLPPYDDAVLQREMALFPDWYLTHEKKLTLSAKQAASLQAVFERIKARNLSGPKVFVHRDYMPRNLMMPLGDGDGLGVLDFQDALHGPITYDIACLMRDAFTSWNDEFVLDTSVRYWERARKAGLVQNGAWGDWADDFGAFWQAVDFMALQRHLKVAGIFARLTHRDGKARYVKDAPRFLRYIRSTASRYAELKPLLVLIDEVEGMDAETTHLRKFGL
jgi:N-acetylmuramate 1-kinase